ncbi:class I SAM-dependent methyltransferase [Pelagibacterales bacterium SAG-MED12]|nr:class I SAM-dependent methyltransferase [Pelagibacterales bacterium SAG-MED12]
MKNWDNKTWLSSNDYIRSFNKFLFKNIKLNSNSKILDIGCGRGKILGTIKSNLKLKGKPTGIDIINHKDKDKRINFKKTDAISFFLTSKKKFDLILIKQTIHLLTFKKIKKLLFLCKKNLKHNGKIFILTLEGKRNELPTFRKMKIRLNKSLKRDNKVLKLITRLYPQRKRKNFIYKVKINKKKYLTMIENKYISILLPLSKREILEGIEEINHKYKNYIQFRDKLDCFVL